MRIRSVTFQAGAGANRGSVKDLRCEIHTVRESYGAKEVGLQGYGAARDRRYRFAEFFVDEGGDPVCDRCVAEGLRAGTFDVTNPEELRAFESINEHVSSQLPSAFAQTGNDGCREVVAAREALDHWGEDALDVLERAIEAARRTGALGELLARMGARDIDINLVSSNRSDGRREVTDRPADSGTRPAVRRLSKRTVAR